MATFRIDEMTCGHCVATLTAALRTADEGAVLAFDLPARLVRVQPQRATVEQLRAAIEAAGYRASLVEETTAPTRRTGGCGCGCGPKKPAHDMAQSAAGAAGACCT